MALLIATVVSAAVGKYAPGSYVEVWSTTMGPSSPLHLDLELHAWINDGLMAVFFFVVGLEIKRELVVGELARPRGRRDAIIAALGGMAIRR